MQPYQISPLINNNPHNNLNLSLVSQVHYDHDQDLSHTFGDDGNLNYEEQNSSNMKFTSNDNNDKESKRRYSRDNDDRSWKRNRCIDDNNNDSSTPSDEKSVISNILIPINNTPLSSIDNDISNENCQVDLNSSLRTDSQTSEDIHKNSQVNDNVVNNSTIK